MACDEKRELIHGYLDHELDLSGSLALEHHIKECPACARLYAEQRSLRSAIAGSSLYAEAPDDLRHRVRTALRREIASDKPARRRTWIHTWAPAAALAAALVLAIPLLMRSSAENRISDEIVSAHIRALMPGHLTDVPSSDQHTVKPWFNGRLDFSPPVEDLASRGFPILGGRMDYVRGRAVAAVVYQRRRHVINLFIWPAADDAGMNAKAASRQGYNVIRWNHDGMTFCAVSDVNPAELAEFARMLGASL